MQVSEPTHRNCHGINEIKTDIEYGNVLQRLMTMLSRNHRHRGFLNVYGRNTLATALIIHHEGIILGLPSIYWRIRKAYFIWNYWNLPVVINNISRKVPITPDGICCVYFGIGQLSSKFKTISSWCRNGG